MIGDGFEQRIDDLIALAALGELSDDQERELDGLLAADAGGQAELDADLATATRLQSIHAEMPPAVLKSRVMDAIARVVQGSPEPERTTAFEGDRAVENVALPQATAQRTERSVGVDPSAVVSIDAARSRRAGRRWQPLAAAAAVAMLVTGGVFAVRSANNGPDIVALVITADDAQVRPFEGDLGGDLRAVYSPEAGALVVDGAGVATLVDSETYQLWLVTDDDVAESVGTFRPDRNGRVVAGFASADPAGRTLGITIEPAGGSDAPTRPIVATA